MNEIFIIGDVHGCYKTLMALIAKLPKNAQLCFVGDLIDRGKHSKEVVEFVREKGYPCVLGNHEARLLKFKDYFLYDLSYENLDKDWGIYGGMEFIESYQNTTLNFRQEHFDYLSNLPIFLQFNDLKNQQGRHLVVSHSAVGREWKNAHLISQNNYDNYIGEHFLWDRGDFSENTEIFNIFGHTPQDTEFPIITQGIANTDMGCSLKNVFKQPRLCAISFPSLKVIMQDNIED